MGLEGLSLDELLRRDLEKPFEEEEVRDAVWNCGIDKSPGPDGFNGLFYRTCWAVVKKDLLRVFDEFHRFGKLCKGY